MSANDELDLPISSAASDSTPEPTNLPVLSSTSDEPYDDHSWMDEPINLVPPKSTGTIKVRVVDGGRGKPMPYPDPLADYEELFGPIDVHSLNVAPGEEAFSFIAKFYDDGEMEPLPYPDPLGDRHEGDDD